MKNLCCTLLLLCLVAGCTDRKPAPQETVAHYIEARDTGNFTMLRTLINDSITITAGDYVMPYDMASFYEVFQWDSVLGTSYEIMELKEQNNKIRATVAMRSDRNAFLQNNPMTCWYTFSFISGKISGIEEMECPGFNGDAWAQKRDSLVEWIKQNHPERNGFIYNMTMQGAMDYTRAMELYKASKNLPTEKN
jgi:hypothetical protein